ncbi:MAG: tyrosine-type recombinase/integrase [Betaproteobacteria bacterium]|nr:tyrosine-type recombinase/integrase [Betaproteobacteria bacterium]
MASVQRRVWTDNEGRQRTTYRVQVRRRGFPPVTATFERKTDADKWSRETEADMSRRHYFPQHEAERHTLADLVDRQLEVVRIDHPHAYNQQRGILGWWKAKLGAYTLATITPEILGRHRDEMQSKEGLAPATVNRYLSSLSKAFSNAVKEWHWLQDNPLRRVSKKPEPKGRVRYLSDEERIRLLDACRKSERPELYLIVLFAITTGMRRGELLGLRWPDVDLERRVAVLHNTKNGDRRSVLIVPEVAELLREHGKVRRLDNDLIFASTGADAVWFDKRWYAALKAAKVKDFRFHDLRHTAASYLAMSGASVPELAAVLGHRTLQMVKRYAHLSDQHTGAVIERMTRKYFG